ncbi:MAG: helicase HerA-like domain-containing protein, partial [Pseudomonadota bacterium]
DLNDFMQVDPQGQGIINILAADKLMMTPKLYATFLLWLLSELFEELPEIGDPDKPVLVFFFDEAHLLFDDAPKALLERIEQVVRLIRSKGVGVYFATQNPMDVPDSVSSQLGNRVQHALRAFTPKEKRVVKAAAETFRANPDFDATKVITELGVGEALVSILLKKGVPSVVARTLIRPPSSRMGPLKKKERDALMADDGLGEKYDEAIDRESAYEILADRAEHAAEEAERAEQKAARQKTSAARRSSSSRKSTRSRSSRRMSSVQKATNQAIRTGTRTLIRELIRGVLGGLKRR